MKNLVRTFAIAVLFTLTVSSCGDDVLENMDLQEIRKDTGNEDDPDSDKPNAG